jgi:hypothetical protein
MARDKWLITNYVTRLTHHMINVFAALLVLFRLDKLGASKNSVEAEGHVWWLIRREFGEPRIWRGKEIKRLANHVIDRAA